jgi:hypothetical protein
LQSIHTKIKDAKANIFFIFAQSIADLQFYENYLYFVLEPVGESYQIRLLNGKRRTSSRFNTTTTKKKSKLVIFVCSSPLNEQVAGE